MRRRRGNFFGILMENLRNGKFFMALWKKEARQMILYQKKGKKSALLPSEYVPRLLSLTKKKLFHIAKQTREKRFSPQNTPVSFGNHTKQVWKSLTK